MKNKPVIGVLLGDPTGIGPEVTAKFLRHTDLYTLAHIIVIGDKRIFQMGQQVAGVELSFPTIHDINDASFDNDQPIVLDYPTISPEDVTYKQVNAKAGKAVYDTLMFTIELSQANKIDGFVFAPLHKEAMGLGGCPFHSEFELFKDRYNCPNVYGEINILEDLWTARVTSHIPLREVSSLITQQRVYETIRILQRELKMFGLERPILAVTALNPHAGEGGMLGTEETDVIAPAIKQAQAEGINANGPFPADTIFLRIKKENYNGIISMYHDQGQIATKLLGFERGVTLHGGIPVPITTPAHGTAYGKAGEGRANAEAMTRAFQIVCQLAKNRV